MTATFPFRDPGELTLLRRHVARTAGDGAVTRMVIAPDSASVSLSPAAARRVKAALRRDRRKLARGVEELLDQVCPVGVR